MTDISALIAQKEKTLSFERAYPATDFVPEAQSGTLSMKAAVTGRAGYLELHADFSLHAQVLCARCATPFDTVFDFTVDMPVAASLVSEDDEADYILAPDGFLDEDEFCRTAAFLNLPARYLCREDCKGLCPDCGIDLNHGSCSCASKKIDPRMAKLKELLEK